LRAHRPARTISAVNALFTSFVPAPRRIARSAVARVLVFVLAITLIAANGFAAAMPFGESSPTTPASAKAATSHMHCADRQIAQRAGHGADCTCGGSSCACMHACDALVLAMPAAVAMPVARVFATLVPRVFVPSASPPLRPPIA
jgi:hypothetical protein